VTLELARRHAWDADEERAGTVPAAIPGWTPFPDTRGALRRLHEAGIQLGILSNIDDDLLAGTLEHFDVPFERLVTAQSLESYKPAVAHFVAGRRWVESAGDRGGEVAGDDVEDRRPGAPGGWIHIAQSLYHDIEPATALGISTVWVNRKVEERSPRAWPVYIARDLSDAVDWILTPVG